MAESHYSGPVNSYQICPGFEVNAYYSGPCSTSVNGGGFAVGSFRACGILIHRPVIVDRIATNIVTLAADATTQLRMGLYSSGSDYKPDRLLVDAGTVPAGTGVGTTGPNSIPIYLMLPPGLYWAGAVNQVGANGAGQSTINSTDVLNLPNGIIGSGENVGVALSSITGALPGTFPTPSLATQVPRIWLRVAQLLSQD